MAALEGPLDHLTTTSFQSPFASLAVIVLIKPLETSQPEAVSTRDEEPTRDSKLETIQKLNPNACHCFF